MKRLLLILLVCNYCFSQSEGTIDSAGSKLFYRTFGSGKPILIINGGPGMNSDGFTGIAETLSKNNMTIIYDQRGTGKSVLDKVDASTITIDLMIQDIENLRKHLKIDRWIVLGHSFGGMLAGYYASIRPESIEAVIMSSSGGIDLELRDYVGQRTNELLPQTQRDSLEYWNRRIAAGDNSLQSRYGRARAMANAYVYNKKYTPIVAERLTQSVPEVNRLVWQDLEKIGFDCAPKLKSFAKPVLILQGKNDILKVSTSEKIHRVLKNSKLILLDKCGHYGWLDAPEPYLSEVYQFLKNV